MSLLLAVSSKSWFPQALPNLLLNPTFSRRLQREHQQPLTTNTTSPSHNMFPVFPSTWILQYSTYNTWSLGYHLISSYSPTTTDDNRRQPGEYRAICLFEGLHNRRSSQQRSFCAQLFWQVWSPCSNSLQLLTTRSYLKPDLLDRMTPIMLIFWRLHLSKGLWTWKKKTAILFTPSWRFKA